VSRAHSARPSTLRHEAFRAIWIAAIFSYIGDWVQSVGQGWLMLSLSHSALYVSMVTTCQTLPIFLLVLPGGVMADRFDRRLILMAALGWQALTALGLATVTWLHVATPALVLTATACLGLGSAFAGPAWQSLVPELVPRSEMPEAVTLNSVAFNMARAVGPALGGLLIGALGMGAAFAVNAASFLAIIEVLRRYSAIRERAARRRGKAEPFGKAVWSLLAHVRVARPMRAIYAAIALYGLAAASIPALLPVFAKQTLAVGERGYGVLLGGMGTGALLGAMLIRRARMEVSARRIVAASIAVYGVCAGLMALTRSFPLAVLLLVPLGAGWLASMSTLNALIQLTAPERLKSRALALYSLVFFAAWALGAALGGTVATAYGAAVTMRVAALCVVAVGLAAAGLPLPAYELPEEELAVRDSLAAPVSAP
jgi:MFS family permease